MKVRVGRSLCALVLFSILFSASGSALAIGKDSLVISDKTLLQPTAIPYRSPKARWTSVLGIYHEVAFTLSENFRAGVSTAVPLGFFGFAGFLQYYPFANKNSLFHFALRIGGGGILPMSELFAGNPTFYGVFYFTPIITVGNERVFVNLVFPMGLFTNRLYRFESTKGETGAIWYWDVVPSAYPGLGLGVLIKRGIRFVLEANSPGFGLDSRAEFKGFLISYGLRLTGKNLFGAIYFNIPAIEGVDLLSFLKYLPLGIPSFNIGYQW